MIELVSTPQEVIKKIDEEVYNIKIKCLACSESQFIPYVVSIVSGNKLTIGEHSFPLNMIEMVTVRSKNQYGKWEYKYKVESKYFRQFLNDAAIQELENFRL